MKVLVLLGGDSPEREISIKSGNAIIDALKNAGFDVTEYDPINGDEGLDKAVNSSDVVLPILHGVNGEDGVIQEKLESLKALFLGSGSVASKHSFNKKDTHALLEPENVKMAKSATVSLADINHVLFKKPFVLKPIEGGSSIDTLIVREIDESDMLSVKKLLKKYKKMIVEQLVEGLEITVPILGGEPLPPIAIIPPLNGEFDFTNKYNGETQEICPIPHELIEKEIQDRAQILALKVHNMLHTRHISRTDMIVKPDGELVVLELNTMPGLTDESLFPRAAKAAGYSMEKLVTRFVELAREEE